MKTDIEQSVSVFFMTDWSILPAKNIILAMVPHQDRPENQRQAESYNPVELAGHVVTI